jgi:hypothetical protein
MLAPIVLLVVAVVGVLAYALASNPKIAELGRIVFFAAVLSALFWWAGWPR